MEKRVESLGNLWWLCICVYMFTKKQTKVCFLLQCLLAITLDGSDSLTGECILTKVQPHSSQHSQRPPKLQDG